MKNSLTKVGASALTFCAVLLLAPTAFAGGSSYEFNTIAHTVLVKSGETLPNAIQLNLQTYMKEDYFKINQIAVKSIKLSCLGENALENARLKLGSDTLATADFVPSTLAPKWYKAILKPENLVLENQSVYNLSIDLKSRSDIHTNSPVLCLAEIIDHDQLYNNTPVDGFTPGMLNAEQNAKSVIIVTPDDTLLSENHPYHLVDLDNQYAVFRPLTVHGNLVQSGKKHQLSVYSSDWVNEGAYNVMIPFRNDATVTFDITSPGYFTTQELQYSYIAYFIQEMHLYPTPSASGAIGKITLKKF